ncbi:MAG: DUF1800 domain-containing protein [Gemmataceae bacterium]|nr:DUF1800 domain-containing protein [Gemmataceae bacterium]
MRSTIFRTGVALALLWALSAVGRDAAGQAPPAAPSPSTDLDPELLKKAATTRAVAQRSLATLTSFKRFVQSRTAAAKSAAAALAAAEAELVKNPADKNLQGRAASARRLAELTLAARMAAEKQLAARIAPLHTDLHDAAQAEATALGGLKPLHPDAWDLARARHLLARAGFGGTPEEVAQLHALGLHLAVDYLIDYQKQPALQLPFDAALPERPLPDEKYRTKQELQVLEARRRGADNQQMQRLRQWWLQRMLQTARPLQEKLALFWHGHFATQQSTVQSSYAMYRQNELFREHAAGNFAALLQGIIHDPAMLRYLDNNTNLKGKPNENLAREIMELFSMGEGQGYTEKDIMEGARALTGYTFEPYASQFRFLARHHDGRPKTIFGKTGMWNGEDFVDLILQQPATARFIAGKLFAYFAYEKPSQEVAERLGNVLRRCDYELTPLLRNLFLSEEFYSARAIGTQIKSPVQLVVGMHRELGQKDVATQVLFFQLAQMGQDLFEPPNVRGWEGGRMWINTNVLVTRYNTIANLVERPQFAPGQPRQVLYLDVAALLEGKEFKTAGEVVDAAVQRYLAVPLAAEKRKELIGYLRDLPPSSQWGEQRAVVNTRLRGLLALLFATPEYQMN